MANKLSERVHFVKGLDPVADALSGTVYSDVVKMSNFNHLTAVLYYGVGATGTVTLTVEACDDAAGSNPVAIPFHSRTITTGDTPGALTSRAAAGYTTVAGSSQIQILEVEAQDFAALDKAWVRVKSVEVVDSPILGGILLLLSEPKFGAPFETAIA